MCYKECSLLSLSLFLPLSFSLFLYLPLPVLCPLSKVLQPTHNVILQDTKFTLVVRSNKIGTKEAIHRSEEEINRTRSLDPSTDRITVRAARDYISIYNTLLYFTAFVILFQFIRDYISIYTSL